ncbi:cadherin repeat domain-containing protein [Bowmanella dokdonensis]|uniref:Cadherin repeat domain-containing protein n=1 Tax=Bowmanella dokdonensis TaxID=751969 RepID=A0A939DQB2_9ALTE|nr:cadherin repeat domain-containing protein [Bowmanella dokdonensis]MBN7826794.1 cadherin repeat domain-containing protein [Bowmanella dokdonensis]
MLATKKTLLAVLVSLGLTACGGSGSDPAPTPTPTPTPTPSNSAPTDVTLSASSVMENAPGAEIGSLSVTDADSGDTHTFSVDDQRFEVDGSTLKLVAEQKLNFESETEITLNVTATDSAGASFTKELTLEVGDELDYYGFESLIPGSSSVNYSGQIARHLLINDLYNFIGSELGDPDAFEAADTFNSRAEVLDRLMQFYQLADTTEYEEVHGSRELLTTTTPDSLQGFLTEVSGSKKDLSEKIAGNDAVGQHKDWNSEFAGWGATGSTTPEGLVMSLFNELADNAELELSGTRRQDAEGNDLPIYLTQDGRDLKQLIQKFLLMSVAYSQGVDDYLDHDTEGKGLLTSNTEADCSGACTVLEHQFDEGFGYFGAARDYLDYSDDEVAGKDGRDDWQGHHDTDGDGAIDFNAEYNFGQSTNAAKRDLGATVATDFSANAMNAFLQGRKIIADAAAAGRELTDDEMTDLLEARDEALVNWEYSIAATVIHYINDSHADLSKLASDAFSLADLAKHWSEMKGFALGLQFNRFSPMLEDFEQLHQLLGDAPVFQGDVEAYQANLIQARDMLQAAYGFEQQNVENW